MRFYLFRIQIFRDPQLHIEEMPMEENEWMQLRPRVVENAIFNSSNPRGPKSRGWRIGNVNGLADSGCIYLRIGRNKSLVLPLQGEKGFGTENIESAPWTHVLVDVPGELCAIASNIQLAASTEVVALALARIVNAAAKREFPHVPLNIELTLIINPESLIDIIYNAHQITRLRATFRRPNAFDVDRDFIEPVQRMTEGLAAERGTVVLEGKDLKRENVEKTIRSVASTGDDAQIFVRERAGARVQKKELRKGNPAIIEVQDESFDEELKSCGIIYQIRALYSNMRQALAGDREPRGEGRRTNGASVARVANRKREGES
ncbi:hypothetical protein [Nannocystis bainbridge]|uniref:Uncharacterized protein n=1 Tax=Nannocystis bainbridge TaxID=2995303 RepID=A0ABT5ECY0_9BACT|nr:hypothetical protein [Nannocystis bainbridge]MDC0723743.1 hypothetical protein [Nannocystis bainbridge]